MVVYILKSIFDDGDFCVVKVVEIAVKTFVSIVLCAVTAVILSWAIMKIGFTPKYIVEGILTAQLLFRAREYVMIVLKFLYAWIALGILNLSFTDAVIIILLVLILYKCM